MANAKKDNVSNFPPPHFFSFTLILSPNFFNKKCIQLMCLLFITQKFILKGEVWGKLYNFVIGFIEAKHFNFLEFGFCAAGEQALVCAPPQRPSSLPSFFPCCTILCSIGALLVLFWWLAVLSAALFWQLLLRSSSRSHI